MPRRPDAPPLTRGVVLRGVLFALAMAFGAVAVWLIVTGNSQKNLRLGMVAMFWGVVCVALAFFGTRRQTEVAHPPVADLPTARERDGHDEHLDESVRRISAEIELHRQNTVERAEDAAARRNWERQLEQLLRSEIRDSVNREMSALRAEIASLRGELLEKVGGQLRLERIETTRVIGSDLEALQEEVRKLKSAADAEEADAYANVSRGRAAERPPFRPVVLPAQVRPVTRETDHVETVVQPARSDAVALDQDTPSAVEMTAPINTAQINEPQINEPQVSEPQVEPAPAPTPAPAPPSASAPAPAPSPAPTPTPASAIRTGVDALDNLPRITPFTDFELDPVEPVRPSGHHAADTSDASAQDAAAQDAADAANYRGRRRRPDDEPTTEGNGRHADRSTGRRHREDRGEHASDNDVLSRLLSDRSSR